MWLFTVTLKIANNFWKKLWLMMTHHHIKFSSKNFSGSEDIRLDKHSSTFWSFAATLTLNTAIQFLRKTLWLMMIYHQTKFGSKRISNSEDIIEAVIFWPYEPLLWPWPLRWPINLFAWHSGSWWCITIPSLVPKCSAVQKIPSWQSFIDIFNLR